MGNGWETRRRRGRGYDWIIINLGVSGIPKEFEINTHFFKGNYPDSFSIQANMENKSQSIKSIVKERIPDGSVPSRVMVAVYVSPKNVGTAA